MIGKFFESINETVKKTFSFKGRATKKEFWCFFLFSVIVYILTILLLALILGAQSTFLNILALVVFGIIWLGITICSISLSVRRLHDLGLSGFWLWYLSPFGLPVVYMVYLLDLDSACERVVGKIHKIGYGWLGWLLAWLFWPCGASLTLFLLFLYDGKKEDNEFGPNPYQD